MLTPLCYCLSLVLESLPYLIPIVFVFSCRIYLTYLPGSSNLLSFERVENTIQPIIALYPARQYAIQPLMMRQGTDAPKT